jgi:ATP-dependent Clp protease protease subunit
MNLCQQPAPQKPSRYESSYIYLSSSRFLFLKDVITPEIASDISALLLYYDNVSNDDITLYIHSPGGDMNALMNIYDVMQMIKSPIQTVCYGMAASAAAVMLAAGTPGKRFAFKNSKIMIHGLQSSFPIPGSDQTSSKNWMDYLNKKNDLLMKILAKHCGQSPEDIKIDCSRDVWLSAKEAMNYGMIDKIF